MIIEERVKYLEDYLKDLCKKGVFPGVSLALLDEKNIYTNYFGKGQLVPEEEELREDAIYDLASLTKVVVTTTSIMMLIERGYLTLDSLVSDILPDYKYPKVTIKHLLVHMSGHDADIDWKGMDREDLIQAVYENLPQEHRFEKEVLYSDIGFILLGFIIEKITGSLEEFARENIFKPLDMKDTFFNPGEGYIDRCLPTEDCPLRDGIVKGLVHDEKSYILGGISGHAGLFSTVRDLSNFVSMYLNDGVFNGKVILNKITIDKIARCYTIGTGSSRGLGWWIKGENTVLSDFASDRTIYHSGFTGTSILIDLDYKKGVILLTNRVHPSRKNTKLVDLRRNIHNIALTSID